MQVTRVTLLIACVLLCPMRCMGAMGTPERADRPQASQERTCSCCSHSEQQPAPSRKSQHCGCGSCLCHGAMVDVVDIDPLDLGNFSYVTPLLEMDGVSQWRQESTASRLRRPCHFPPLATGRDLCALTSTLLL